MSTSRYLLPGEVQQTDTVRVARVLAAIVLAATVIVLSLLAVILPAADGQRATSAEGGAAAAPVLAGA